MFLSTNVSHISLLIWVAIISYEPVVQSSATFCYPSITLWDVHVDFNLANQSITAITELRPFTSASSNFSELSANITGPPLSGRAYNGIEFDWTNEPDQFVLARKAAIRLQLPAAVFQAAVRGPGGLGRGGAFDNGGFVMLCSRVYVRYKLRSHSVF